METVDIDGGTYRGIHLPTERSALLVLQGAKGFLGFGETCSMIFEKQ